MEKGHKNILGMDLPFELERVRDAEKKVYDEINSSRQSTRGKSHRKNHGVIIGTAMDLRERLTGEYKDGRTGEWKEREYNEPGYVEDTRRRARRNNDKTASNYTDQYDRYDHDDAYKEAKKEVLSRRGK